jgi:hypothetical protein
MAAMLEESFALRGVDATRRAVEREGEVWRAAVGVDHGARGCTLGLARKAWRRVSEEPPPLRVNPAFSFQPTSVDGLTAALLRAAAAEPGLARRAPGALAVRTRFALGVLGLVARGELSDARVAQLAFGSLSGEPIGVHLSILDHALVALESLDEDGHAAWLRILERASVDDGPSARASHRLLQRDQRFAREYLTCRHDGPVSMRVTRIPPAPRRPRVEPLREDLFAP